jgi:hypothetical protein
VLELVPVLVLVLVLCCAGAVLYGRTLAMGKRETKGGIDSVRGSGRREREEQKEGWMEVSKK